MLSVLEPQGNSDGKHFHVQWWTLILRLRVILYILDNYTELCQNKLQTI